MIVCTLEYIVKLSESWSEPFVVLPLVLRDHVLRGKLKCFTL
jgi:hypothetical protein